MMRYCMVLLLPLFLAFTHADEDLYTDKYDYIDVYEIVLNDKLREQYYKCFMDLGPCITADAIYCKTHLVEAFQTKCKKCTEKQKENFNILANWYVKNQPEKWNAFVEKILQDMKSMEKVSTEDD